MPDRCKTVPPAEAGPPFRTGIRAIIQPGGSKKDDEGEFGELEERLLGPAQKTIELGGSLQCETEGQKVERQEDCQPEPGQPVDDEGEVGRMTAMARHGRLLVGVSSPW